MQLPYDQTSPEEIRKYGEQLIGKKLCDIKTLLPFKFIDDKSGVHSKSEVGDFYEAYYGIKKNQRPEPDFPEAGVELKEIPIERGKRKLRIKERTKICTLNYMTLLDEHWHSSAVRKKTRQILFIFFEHVNGTPKAQCRTLAVLLWRPAEIDDQVISADWTKIYNMVDGGQAHQLSESLTRYLGACTSGTGKPRPQPRNPTQPAPERSFALKQAFTRQIWEEKVQKRLYESVMQNLHIRGAHHFDRAVLEHLHKFENMTISEIAKRLDIPLTTAKNNKALIIRKCLGAKKDGSKLVEFEKQGIVVKTVPVNAKNMQPFESTSFPHFNPIELVEEQWETSELRTQTEKILFVPLLGTNRKHKGEFALGHAFFWQPTPEEEAQMELEWHEYVRIIKENPEEKLPPASKTRIIHIRPHGRNKKDQILAPGGKMVQKSSFWLNASFVADLIKKHHSSR